MSGSAARTRTPTGCCASTFQRAPTSARTAPRTLQPWRWPSTAGRERRSAGEHLPRLWTSSSNPVTQAVLRRPLESTLWVRTFDTVEELRQALLAFREVYNTTWLIERHGFQTPAAVRQNQLSPAAMAA